MTYTQEKPALVPSAAELRDTIPGWGTDLDPADRPAVPKENYRPGTTGAHWRFPDRQQQKAPREVSTEHKFLPPVFGTSAPTRGLSGVVRRLAYRRYGEGRLAHWLLLVFADKIDVLEGKVIDLAHLRIPNAYKEMGLGAERKYHGLRSRRGQHRADLRHPAIDVGLVLGRTALFGAGLLLAARAVSHALTPPKRRRLLGVF